MHPSASTGPMEEVGECYKAQNSLASATWKDSAMIAFPFPY